MPETEIETHQSFEAMILASIKEKKDVYDSDNEERLRQAVTLEYRDRKNYFGTFNTLKNRRLEYVGSLGKGLVTYPVVPRALRSKQATSLATEVKFDLKPSRNLPELEAAADLAQNIAKRCDEQVWDEDFEINSVQLRMKQRLCYYRIFNNFAKGIRYQQQVQSPELEQIEIHGRIFGCPNCGLEVGEENLSDPNEIADESSNLLCPECRSAHLTSLAGANTKEINPFRTETFRTGEPDVDLISALLTRIDDLPCTGLQFENAGWFNVNKLVPLLELQRQFPILKKELGSSNFEKWSPGTHWWYALTKEQGNFHYSKSLGDSYRTGLRLYHELEKWFFSPKNCEGWKSPDDWKLHATRKDTPDFDFQKDETIKAAILRQEQNRLTAEQSGESGQPIEFLGICVWVANGKVLKIENASFQDDYGVIGWQISPTSYFPQGEEGLNQLQDAATNVLSMLYSSGMKRNLAPLVKTGEFFDDEDITRNQTGGVINAKTDSGVDLKTLNLRNHIFYLESAPNDPFIWQLAELIIQIQKEESGIYDETVGQVNSQNQTMGGRMQAVNQSLSLMLSPSKSKKRGKQQLIKKVLKQWQKLPGPAFQMIRGSFNEEWKQQDIQAFKNLDIDNDLIFRVVEGSDVPSAATDAVTPLMTVAQLGLLAPDNPLPIDFRLKLLRALGVDYDPQNADASKRLAGKRLQLLKAKIAQVNPADAYVVVAEPVSDVPDAETGEIPTIQRKELNPQLLQDVMSDIRLQARETENHQVMMEFFADQINGELGKDMPNEVLLSFLDEMIKQHLSTLDGAMSKEAATRGKIEATGKAVADETHRALTGADEKEQAMMQMRQQGDDRQAQAETEARSRELTEKQADRRHDMQKHLISVHNKPNGNGSNK